MDSLPADCKACSHLVDFNELCRYRALAILTGHLFGHGRIEMLVRRRRKNDLLTTLALKALEAVDCERLIPRNMHLLRKICFEMHGVAGSTDGTVRELVFFSWFELDIVKLGDGFEDVYRFISIIAEPRSRGRFRIDFQE